MMIIGGIAFLYGSNIYNATVGWGGLFIAIAGLIGEVTLQVYAYLKKMEVG
jgi:hypothetical protein